jgi:hypothetical protein
MASVLSLTDSDPIGSGVRYPGQATTNASAKLGIHVVRAFRVAGGDTDGSAKSIQPVNGAIEVVAAGVVGVDAVPRVA